jgi:2-oxoglutarate dehydrogenase E2 component (dihydrolipoamide succinyltransferase)
MVEIIMPQMGESIFEATITRWLKKVGDAVAKDEPLFEISTDKIDTEIPSPVSGTISRILVGDGQKVPVKTVVAEVAAVGEAAPRPAPPPPPPRVERPKPVPVIPAADEGAYTMRIPSAEARALMPARPAGAPAGEERVLSSPLVRKMARDHGIDLGAIKGSGWKNRITKKDIEEIIETRKQGVPAPPAAAPTPPPPPPAPAAPAPIAVPRGPRDEVVPMSAMRAKIAEHMVHSRRTSAHVTTVFEVDMGRVDALRRAEKETYERVYGTKLTFTHFFAMAAVRAIGKHPILNASVDGGQIVFHHDINLGIAVSIPDGLIVPVVRHAEELSFLGLARAVNDVARRAREKKLTLEEIQGGTFTITNPGVYGGLFGTPIINQPQVAILGIGAVEKRPVVIDDAIAIRPMCYLDLSFDHRAIDGAAADVFMAEVKKTLETWDIPVK